MSSDIPDVAASARQNERLRALLEVGCAFSRELSPDALLQLVIAKTTEILDADRSTLLLIDRDRGELWSRIAEDLEISEIRFPVGLGLEGHVVATGETINLPNAYDDARFNRDVDRRTGYRTRSILCMPVRGDDGAIVGVIEALNKRTEIFDAEDEVFMAFLARQASIALKNAYLVEELAALKCYNEGILHSMGTAVITVGPDGRVKTVNPAAVRVFGLDELRSQGATLSELLNGEKNRKLVETICRALPEEKVYTGYRLEYHTRVGEMVHINLRMVPLVDTDGRNHGFVLVADDISKEQRLVNTFCRYMEREVVEQVLAHPELPNLRGIKQGVTVLFSDIRSYTSITERSTAEEVAAMLNDYFSRMVKQVFRFGGMLDKYIGDAIMAVFGAPIGGEDDALRAALAAVAMRRELWRYNEERLTSGKGPIEIGIGLGTGEAICGNIGSEDRVDYTVIGDVVNVASRLEGLTKLHDCKILINEGMHDAISGIIPCVDLGLDEVKGHTGAIRVFGIADDWIRGDGAAVLTSMSASPS
jgi:adenylate cyclase